MLLKFLHKYNSSTKPTRNHKPARTSDHVHCCMSSMNCKSTRTDAHVFVQYQIYCSLFNTHCDKLTNV